MAFWLATIRQTAEVAGWSLFLLGWRSTKTTNRTLALLGIDELRMQVFDLPVIVQIRHQLVTIVEDGIFHQECSAWPM